jgi:hypothetical protein
MKPSTTFTTASLVMFSFIMIYILIHSHFLRQSLELRNKEIMLYTNKLEDFKKALKNTSDESVTKADIADLIDMSSYQSEKDRLRMENQFDLAKGYDMIILVYFVLLLILRLSFQLDNIRKQLKLTEVH